MVAVCRANSDSGFRLIALAPSKKDGYAFFNTPKALSHEERLHNADTYSIFAFENTFGKDRVVKMFPLLR